MKIRDQYIVFTGDLQFPRKAAISLVEKMGGKVQSSVTRKTTILVVGDQDQGRLREGYSISRKQELAEKLKRKGRQIKIITKEKFYKLIDRPVQLSLIDFAAEQARKKRRISQKGHSPSSHKIRTAKSEVQPSKSI